MSKDILDAMTDPSSDPNGTDGGSHFKDNGEDGILHFCSPVKHTIESVFEQSGVDSRVWAVDSITTGTWQQGQRVKMGGDSRPAIVDLWKISLRLKRKMPQNILSSFEWLADHTAKRKIGTVKPIKQDKKAEPEMMVAGLKDIHIGKYGCEEECGENTDCDITVRRVQETVADGMARVGKARNISRILLPIGSDFYNVDNWEDTTYAGTRQDTDTRFKRVFRVGCMLMEGIIQQLRTIAPVEYVYCPGNHDTSTSWYLTEWLRATFKGQDDVRWIENDQELSYHQHGVSLVGLYHGHKMRAKKLCEIMPFEQPQAWAETTTREWLTGHRHTQMVESHGGVVCRTLPSLSGTDAWHRNNGYTTSPKAAEVYYYGQETGLCGMDLWTAKS